MPTQLLFLEFNEINFEGIAYYCARGLLPNLNDLITRNGWATTYSEDSYEELEPWIQWVTAHTGRTLAEHQVFRLGDIVNHDLVQIWELLEDRGLSVGAISPMNAKHRLRSPAFFVPDPWTKTAITATPVLRRLYHAIAQAVNDNAVSRVTLRSAWDLLCGLLLYAGSSNYSRYARMLATGMRSRWRKAILLDTLLVDVFIREVRRTNPNFATLFLNAGAHIQHHYLFSSAFYKGPHRNPAWYLSSGFDPVLEVYEAYDRALRDVRRAFPSAQIMIATGLHQEPHGQVTYYWRLSRHADFLSKIRVPFVRIEPRMSRDFLIVCASSNDATKAQQRLAQAVAWDGTPLFEVDNRGNDLFVMLTYPHEIASGLRFRIGSENYSLEEDEVAFVALKNGEHSGVGYFLDSECCFKQANEHFPLTDVPGRITRALEMG